MTNDEVRAEIILNGLVQGVGFRYFVLNAARALGLKGVVKNLYTGEVLIIAEGEKYKLDELIKKVKIGPSHAAVKNCRTAWGTATNEFESFGITD